MTIDVTMPALSPTMESGTLAKWLVSEGDSVQSGDMIAEIETDKATMEVESIEEGRVGKILVPEGTEDVAVGARIAVLLEEGEDESALEGIEADGGDKKAAKGDDSGDDDSGSEDSGESDRAARSHDTGKDAPADAGATDPGGKAPPAPTDDSGKRIFASPLARRIAQQKGVDLTTIEGSGPHGRIVRADIEAAAGKPAARDEAAASPAKDKAPAEAPATAAAPSIEPPADVPYEEVKMSGMRKVIARRMTESKSHVPHFYLTIDTAVDRLLAQRKELNAKLEADGVKLSVNDFIIRASALALKQVPAANAMFAGDKLYYFQRQDISVAVAIEGGLITPVIRDAGAKGLKQISVEMKDLAAKARDGKLTPEDYQGGTFSISNLGMYGIREFGAVINPPQGAILAIGAGEKRPVVDEDGAVTVRTVMTCTLSVDHRALDGAIGAEFLSAFRGFIEDPITMLL